MENKHHYPVFVGNISVNKGKNIPVIGHGGP
jgi:hypothetical protein